MHEPEPEDGREDEVLPESPPPGELPPEAAATLPDEPPVDERLEEVVEPVDAAEPAREPTGRVVLRRLGATTSALVLLAAVTGAVVAGEATAPPPAQSLTAPVVNVPPVTTTTVCAAPPTLTAGSGMGVDPSIDPADVTTRSRTELVTLPREGGAAAAASAAELGGGATDLARTGSLRALAITDPAGEVLFAAEPDGVAALAAGASVARTDAGDLRGLTASACLVPATTTWLVGGGTQPGQSTQLVLTNPGQTPVTADVTLWSSLGAVEAPRLQGLVVAPGQRTAVLLEASATADARIAMRVDAAGGKVTATLQDHQLDGVVPAGVETVTPTLPPALELTVPGVRLARSTLDDVASSAVRVVNPGEEEATVTVRLLGADGVVEVPGAEEIVIDPGAVADISLAGLEPGDYAAEISADQPVTGAVVLARTGTAGELDPDVAPVDRAWTAPSTTSSGTLLVPGNGTLVDAASLALTNPADTDASVTLLPWSADGVAGTERVVEVPARSTVAVAVDDLGAEVAAVQLLPASGEAEGGTTAEARGVLAAVVLTAAAPDGELVSVLPLLPDPHDARTVRVAIR